DTRSIRFRENVFIYGQIKSQERGVSTWYQSFDLKEVGFYCRLSKLRPLVDAFAIPFPNGDILEIHGERPEGNLKQLKTMKVNESKLKDILIVHEFLDVFPEDLSGLPPSRERCSWTL
nr:putative reverse transcriptase domain-containing protein [Tanacetum cinerariifolium]